jgi:hypothetical protein
MPLIKQMLELVRQRLTQAKGARAAKNDPPNTRRKDTARPAATRGVEITRAVYPGKNRTG